MLTMEHFDSPVAIGVLICRFYLGMCWAVVMECQYKESTIQSLSPPDIRTATGQYLTPIFPITNCKIFSFGLEWTLLIYFVAKQGTGKLFTSRKSLLFIKNRVFVSGMMFLGTFPYRSWVKCCYAVVEFKLFIFSFAKMVISHVGIWQVKVITAQHGKIKYFRGGRYEKIALWSLLYLF